MSRVVLVCHRDGRPMADFARKIAILNRHLTPDNIEPHEAWIDCSGSVDAAVLNPVDVVRRQAGGICLGMMLADGSHWSEAGAESPEGSYALFRWNEAVVELVSDAAASRTIWYLHTDDVFVASTSQRAIVALTGRFEFEERTLGWMLSTGALGPDLSWDKRIRGVACDTRVRLNRDDWSLESDSRAQAFSAIERSHDEYKQHLASTIQGIFDRLDLSRGSWSLPLSGGYDSRLILLMLKDRAEMPTITWGLKSALDDPVNDASVARRLAHHLNVSHQFFETDFSDEPFDRLLHRYLVAGEGRGADIGGYLDGFQIWKSLFESRVSGVIRGDEGFGWHPVYSVIEARRSTALTLLEDHSNLAPAERYGLPEQRLPASLERKDRESLATWRDRLYHAYRLPVHMAAYNDLKCAFVELINPLLSRGILNFVRSLPDRLRTEKRLYREWVTELSPPVPFAKSDAIGRPQDFLSSRAVVELVQDELSSVTAVNLFGNKLLSFVRDRLQARDTKRQAPTRELFKKQILRYAPRKLIGFGLGVRGKRPLNPNVLALRACIAHRAQQMFNTDAALFSRAHLTR